MPKVTYTKPALTYAAQLQQLKDRGLVVENDAKALHLLENISYYRLSGYWYPMLAQPKKADVFKNNSSFNNAFNLYCFDKELRRLVLSELEKIEIAIRAKMIYILSHSDGPFWFRAAYLFSSRKSLTKSLLKLRDEDKRSDEEFIKSFHQKYTDPLPPSWMILETSSFGNLSHIYKNLKPSRNKRDIANYFKLDEKTFESWLHSIVYVRNICAHHARLWNRKMSISPKIPNAPKGNWITVLTLENPVQGLSPIKLNNTSYYLLCMIAYLLNVINPKHTFKQRLVALFQKFQNVDVEAMGFPRNWENEQLWL